MSKIRVHSKSGKFIAILPESLQGLPDRPIRLEFAANGDLVDISTSYDGEDILALSQDAQSFGETCIERRRKA